MKRVHGPFTDLRKRRSCRRVEEVYGVDCCVGCQDREAVKYRIENGECECAICEKAREQDRDPPGWPQGGRFMRQPADPTRHNVTIADPVFVVDTSTIQQGGPAWAGS